MLQHQVIALFQGLGRRPIDQNGVFRIIFSQRLQTCGHVDCIADDGVHQPLQRTNLPGHSLAGTDANTVANGLFTTGDPALIQLDQSLPHCQCRSHGMPFFIRLFHVRPKYGHNRVTNKIIDIPSPHPDGIAHLGQIFIQKCYHLLGRHLFRNRRETADVREEYGNPECFAAEVQGAAE